MTKDISQLATFLFLFYFFLSTIDANKNNIVWSENKIKGDSNGIKNINKTKKSIDFQKSPDGITNDKNINHHNYRNGGKRVKLTDECSIAGGYVIKFDCMSCNNLKNKQQQNYQQQQQQKQQQTFQQQHKLHQNLQQQQQQQVFSQNHPHSKPYIFFHSPTHNFTSQHSNHYSDPRTHTNFHTDLHTNNFNTDNNIAKECDKVAINSEVRLESSCFIQDHRLAIHYRHPGCVPPQMLLVPPHTSSYRRHFLNSQKFFFKDYKSEILPKIKNKKNTFSQKFYSAEEDRYNLFKHKNNSRKHKQPNENDKQLKLRHINFRCLITWSDDLSAMTILKSRAGKLWLLQLPLRGGKLEESFNAKIVYLQTKDLNNSIGIIRDLWSHKAKFSYMQDGGVVYLMRAVRDSARPVQGLCLDENDACMNTNEASVHTNEASVNMHQMGPGVDGRKNSSFQ